MRLRQWFGDSADCHEPWTHHSRTEMMLGEGDLVEWFSKFTKFKSALENWSREDPPNQNGWTFGHFTQWGGEGSSRWIQQNILRRDSLDFVHWSSSSSSSQRVRECKDDKTRHDRRRVDALYRGQKGGQSLDSQIKEPTTNNQKPPPTKKYQTLTTETLQFSITESTRPLFMSFYTKSWR